MNSANDGVAHQVCLMWKYHEGEHNLRCVCPEVSPDTPEVTGPGNTAWMEVNNPVVTWR
jgi:hypothetical protein